MWPWEECLFYTLWVVTSPSLYHFYTYYLISVSQEPCKNKYIILLVPIVCMRKWPLRNCRFPQVIARKRSVGFEPRSALFQRRCVSEPGKVCHQPIWSVYCGYVSGSMLLAWHLIWGQRTRMTLGGDIKTKQTLGKLFLCSLVCPSRLGFLYSECLSVLLVLHERHTEWADSSGRDSVTILYFL
jgi:hypothetical protein